MVDRKLSFFHFSWILLLLLYPFLCIYYILLSLLYFFLLLPVFNSMSLCNYHTICCRAVLYSRNPVPSSLEFLSPFTYIFYTSQITSLFTLSFILLPLLLDFLEVYLLQHNALSPSFILSFHFFYFNVGTLLL